MSNRKRDTTGLRTPDVIRAGQDRVVHQTTVDPIRPHRGDTETGPAASAPHCRLAASRAALGATRKPGQPPPLRTAGSPRAVPLSDHPQNAPRGTPSLASRIKRRSHNPHSQLTIPRVRSIRLVWGT